MVCLQDETTCFISMVIMMNGMVCAMPAVLLILLPSSWMTSHSWRMIPLQTVTGIPCSGSSSGECWLFLDMPIPFPHYCLVHGHIPMNEWMDGWMLPWWYFKFWRMSCPVIQKMLYSLFKLRCPDVHCCENECCWTTQTAVPSILSVTDWMHMCE